MNRFSVPLLALVLASISQLQAQVGNNNPTGVSGIFNGNITTGCSYDPFTGTTNRTTTEIVLPAVGEYPLALTRTSNSRAPSATGVFGAGGWNHNYNWILEDSPSSSTANFPPASYTVDFPDGRVEIFRSVTWDSNYRVRPGGDGTLSGSAGVRERFQPLNLSTMLAYLVLPDGGKVEFTAAQHSFQQNGNTRYYYRYRARAIIDPYGLRTTFTYEVTPNGNRRLQKVTEPAGRYIQFFYPTTNGPRIGSVTASDGRTVQYYYTNISPGGTPYTALTSVVYYGNTNWTARYTYRSPNVLPASGLPLLLTADDPMYPGPMKRIAYEYKTGSNPDGTSAVYGQILSERYWDGIAGHEASGAAVSTLIVGTANPINHNIRTETRPNGETRTFIYNGDGYVTWASDFTGHQSSQTYDDKKYINSVTNFNRKTTDYSRDPITGNVTQIKFPLTPDDTPGQGNTRPTVNYSYTNDYYLYTVQDEGGHTTTIDRGGNNRISSIVYPDGGWESFTYDPNHFYQLSSHRMTTGGTETFTYDGLHRRGTYRNPSNASGNPTARYQYDAYDRIRDVTDVLDHTTSFTYNLRSQLTVTTLPTDPVDGIRHTIINAYNPDGTLQNTTNELNRITSYTYDDYRRLKSVTPPVRGAGDTNPHTTSFSYHPDNPTGDYYQYTDSNVTYVTLPSGKKIKAIYDYNRRKTAVTAGYGTSEAATTSYGYDYVGNLTSVKAPKQQDGQQYAGKSTITTYDERNRPSSIKDALDKITSFTYDTAGRRKTVARPNGQIITYNAFDAMNRVLQQTAIQTPDPVAVTNYTYTPAGLLETMQDPRGNTYSHIYDSMGRKRWVIYPEDSNGVQRVEGFTYDTAGRLETFRNRAGYYQTFTYDALNRMSDFSWNDGLTPSVHFGYDVASRLTSIANVNATISRQYFNDNSLRAETQSITGVAAAKTVNYTYDADGNRASIQYPDTYLFSYTYTERNQLKSVGNNAIYTYDLDGNLATRTPANGTSSTYTYDALDQVTSIVHALNGTTRRFDYAYDNVGNRKWTKREGNVGDVFGYDLADQVTGVQLNVANPSGVQSIPRTIIYDANGNRTSFSPYGPTDTYTINNNSLNQYNRRNNVNAVYDVNGNLATGFDLSGYTYDALNRLISATKGNVTETFKYDGLNRQVSRTVDRATTYNTYDGWDLIEEVQANGSLRAMYLYGSSGLILSLNTWTPFWRYHYQDGSGSVSHVANTSGNLLEWYRYDLQGTPIFYNAGNAQMGGSNQGVRNLFTGQQWYSELGLYDLRNRFYSPDIGRFLQPDPIGFWGDGSNLYRYVGNNPVNWSDPSGLDVPGVKCSICNPYPEYPGYIFNPPPPPEQPSIPITDYGDPGSGSPSFGGNDLPSGGPGPTFGVTLSGGGNFGDHGFGGGGENGGERGDGGPSFLSQIARGSYALIPGAIAYDNMRANWAAGNTGLAVVNGITWVGEQTLFVFTLGQSVAAQTAARSMTIANPVPSMLARVIPGRGPFTTLGPPSAADVFVTDAAAIEGLTSAQLSGRLGMAPSSTFTVIRFPTPSQGLATPVFRSNPGFVGGGLTSGGAPEFVVPNGPIPAGATATVLGGR
jgi:RHS repeat-associated protein